MVALALYLIAWVIYFLPLFVIAHRCGSPWAWLAFVPLGNLWLMCDLADREAYFMLLVLIPGVGPIIFGLLMWTAIAENTNKPAWLGAMMVLPIVNLPASYYMAFADSGRIVA